MVTVVVYLINPPIYNAAKSRENEFPYKSIMPNLEVGYINSILEEAGFDTIYIDCPISNVFSFCDFNFDKITDGDIVVLFIFNHSNIFEISKFIRKIKKLEKDTIIICSGDFFSIDTERYLKLMPEIDLGVVGDDKYIWPQIIHSFTSKSDLKMIQKGAFISEKLVTGIENTADLNQLPKPKINYSNQNTAPILISKACYGSCSFCALHLYNSQYKVIPSKRSPESIWVEIDDLHKVGIKYFVFQDDNFLGFQNKEYSKKWIESFCLCSTQRNYTIKFHIYARVDDLLTYQKYLPQLITSGLDEIFVGMESFSDRQLELYSKRIKTEENIKAFKLLKKAGIAFEIGTIIFEPTVSSDEILLNYQTIKRLKYYKTPGNSKKCISLASDITIIKDTKIEEYYHKNGLYTQNNKFNYLDSKAEKINEIKNHWREELIKVQDMDVLIHIAKNKSLKKEYAKLVHLKNKLVKLDLDFIINICQCVIHNTSHLQVISNRYLKKLEKLKKQFQAYLYVSNEFGVSR